jgi:hypothetical protein
MLPKEQESQPSPGVYLLFSCFQGRGRERVLFEHEKNEPLPPFEKPYIYVSLQRTTDDLDNFIKPGQIPEGYIKFLAAASTGSWQIHIPCPWEPVGLLKTR